MFAANLTLGLYVQFGPKPLTPNSTMGLEGVPLGGTEQPAATPTNYLTLVPLLATMLFIMGRRGSAGGGGRGGLLTREGGAVSWLFAGGALLSTPSHQQGLSTPVPSGQATPWAGGPSPGCSCLRSCP